MLTDNNPITYVLTTAKLDATGKRWVASLCDYDFVIKYRSGRKNIDADRLSLCLEPAKEKIILPDVIKALSFSLGVESCPLVERVALSGINPTIASARNFRPAAASIWIDVKGEEESTTRHTSFKLYHGQTGARLKRICQKGC